MKKGFTLLELIVVIIIIGILATLGLTQYARMVEKSRGAEARSVIGAIRNNASAIYMQNSNSCATCTNANIGIGAGLDYPNPCAATHYFSYNITAQAATSFTVLATRCGAAGKAPPGPAGLNTIQLATDFAAGTDTWTYAGAYQ